MTTCTSFQDLRKISALNKKNCSKATTLHITPLPNLESLHPCLSKISTTIKYIVGYSIKCSGSHMLGGGVIMYRKKIIFTKTHHIISPVLHSLSHAVQVVYCTVCTSYSSTFHSVMFINKLSFFQNIVTSLA